MKKIINVPDEAYVLVKETACRREPCIICDGTGSVGLKHKTFLCPQCNGTGSKMEYGSANWGVKGPAIFKSLSITMDRGKVIEKLGYDVSQVYLHGVSVKEMKFIPTDVFESYDEAMAEVKRRNKGDNAAILMKGEWQYGKTSTLVYSQLL